MENKTRQQTKQDALILAVDDEELNLELLKLAIKDSYKLLTATSGEDCLKIAREKHPDIILLDINMPGMSGYEVCQQIKNDVELRDIQIMFVSGLDSLDERMAGYDAGGDDYITKPFNNEELLSKINLAASNKDMRAKLQSEVSNAMETAMIAMTSTGELGVVLEFLSTSYAVKTNEALADSLLASLSNYGLSCSVQVRTPHEIIDKDASGVSKPLESALLQKMLAKGRIIDFGSRCIINYPNVSILIKNMPLDDMEKYGRYKDNLALLVEGANARSISINNETVLNHQRKILVKLLQKTQTTLSEISDNYQQHKLKNARIVDQLQTSVEEAFIRLDLSEDQENRLLEIVNRTANSTNALYEQGLELDKQFDTILQQLQAALGE